MIKQTVFMIKQLLNNRRVLLDNNFFLQLDEHKLHEYKLQSFKT